MLRGTNNDNEVSLKACVSADQSAALMAALSLLWELDPWRGVLGGVQKIPVHAVAKSWTRPSS